FWDGYLPTNYDAQNAHFYTHPLPSPAYPINSTNPIPGALNGKSVCVLDDTPLFFSDVSEMAELIGIHTLNIAGGAVSTRSVSAKSGIFISPRCAVRASFEISASGIVQCHGGEIEAASIDARRIRFDSAGGSLNVSIQGSVITAQYEQYGGSVTIGGGIYIGADPESIMSVNGDYAYHNPAELLVTGDITSAGEIIIGKPWQNAHINVLGDMRAEQSISISGGKTFIRGTIESRDGNINVIGGVVNAGALNAAGELSIGTVEDFYGLNDKITVFIADTLQTKDPVRIFGGAVYDGNNIA
ncbi:MAG: hypothetical protein FWC90_07020, partial [Oscillospiraceae bacterium]|nr:hypothetical protein [Oscillospiraceae bacterium]